MKIRQLKLFPQEPKKPIVKARCQEEIHVYSEHERQWRVQRYPQDPMRCTRDAAIEIDDKMYCRLHGGHRLVDLALAGKLVVKEKSDGEA